MITFVRVSIFSSLMMMLSQSKVTRSILKLFIHTNAAQEWMLAKLQMLRNQGVVYFTKHANLSQINRALQYIEENEEARWVRVIHVYADEERIPGHLLEYVQLLNCV